MLIGHAAHNVSALANRQPNAWNNPPRSFNTSSKMCQPCCWINHACHTQVTVTLGGHTYCTSSPPAEQIGTLGQRLQLLMLQLQSLSVW
jgi:hypothetical protein